MPEIRMRPKHQLALPAQIVSEAKLSSDDRLEVTYTNGVIVLTPRSVASSSHEFDIMAYAGIGKGMFWGASKKWTRLFINCAPDSAI